MPAAKPTLSTDTLTLLYELLGSVQLPVSHPDFADKAAAIVKAKAELEQAITPAVPSSNGRAEVHEPA